jgi:Na+-exporting ATPase
MAEKPSPTANAGHNEKTITRENTGATGATATSQSLPFAPHTALSSKVLEALHADPRIGLSESEVAGRLEAHGPNRLKPPKRPSPLAIVMRQIGNAMTLVLSELLFPNGSESRFWRQS